MATINTNTLGATTSSISVVDSDRICVYIGDSSGSHDQHWVGIEISPDGTTWFDTKQYVAGINYKCINVTASHARLKVIKAEGSASVCNYWILSAGEI